MPVDTHEDLPLNEAAAFAAEKIQQGGTVFAKFTCAHCGARQTFETPNKIYLQGECEECNGITNISEWGFMVIYGRGGFA